MEADKHALQDRPMKHPLPALSRQYQDALRKHLSRGPKSPLEPAQRLGRQAATRGLETLDLARIHKAALSEVMPPDASHRVRARLARQAGRFFYEVITPIERAHRAGVASASRLQRKNKTLARRTAQLVAASLQLQNGIARRKAAEKALRTEARQYTKRLRESHHLQTRLQNLVHQILSSQEEDRKKISRDLRDDIAQTLLGINIRLLTLQNSAVERSRSFAKEIAGTQRVVEKSAKTIHRFARKVERSR